MTFWRPPIHLASGSPRRRQLLDAAGVSYRLSPPGIDDGHLTPPAVAPAWWALSMAYLKGRDVADRLQRDGGGDGTVLAADTVCELDGRIIGQPADVDAARSIVRAFRQREHVVISGVCLLELGTGRRLLFADRAVVRWGPVDDPTIERYLATGGWRGKAGAYNLEDRQDDGWPIECEGDPATVMGLPMRRLLSLAGTAPPA